MVAEFVTQRDQECTERGDLFPHCCPHPDANQHCFWVVIPEEFRRPIFTYSQWSCREHSDLRRAGLYRNLKQSPEIRRNPSEHLEQRTTSSLIQDVSQNTCCGRSRSFVRSLLRNSA